MRIIEAFVPFEGWKRAEGAVRMIADVERPRRVPAMGERPHGVQEN